ncbi:MAG: M48 family metalloprotease [Gammaproteobacteria bacterium]|nr:M48 family metalloprotease [Gammaproteobacteria bacterium]
MHFSHLSCNLRFFFRRLLFTALIVVSNAVYAELPDLGDPTLKTFGTEEEKKLGLMFFQTLKNNLAFIDDPQLNYYIKNLGQKLATHSDAADKNFKFFIIDSAAINAFAGPDAHIGINSGLFLESANESQLASVMAHEISHVSQRHLARAIDKSGTSAIATFATVLAAILLGSQDSQVTQAVLYTGLAGAQQNSINFTRTNEYEADRIGIGILAKSGINPQGMVDFFSTLLSKSSDGGIEYLRTHPLNTNRVSEAKDRVQKIQLNLPEDSQDFQFAHARLEVLSNTNPSINIKPNIARSSNDISLYKYSLELIRNNNLTKAITNLETLSKRNNHPWIKLALAKAYQSNNQSRQSLTLLKELSEFFPGYLPVTLLYADTLTINGHASKSISLLKHQLQTNDQSIIYKTLARAYFKNGQIDAALESTGDQYEKEGYYELALQQYEMALQQPNLSVTTNKRLQTKKETLKLSTNNKSERQ